MKKQKTEILYGFHPVLESLKAGRRDIVEVFVLKNKAKKRHLQISDLTQHLKIPLHQTGTARLDALAGTKMHQGIAARVSPYPLFTLDEVIEKSAISGTKPLLLLLDSILDPHNLGALIRTALCAGVDGVVIPKDRSAAPTPAVSKTSAGALEHMTVAGITNMVKSIQTLKTKGLWIIGMDKGTDTPVYDSDLTCPIAVVVGGEEKGIRPLVKKQCDYLASIPQAQTFNSLNASVAGAIVMYEAFRQRTVSNRR